MSIQEPAEERLLFALSDLVRQEDFGEYRASGGRRGEHSLACAQAIVGEFGISHEAICAALDHHGDNLRGAADSLFAAAANAA